MKRLGFGVVAVIALAFLSPACSADDEQTASVTPFDTSLPGDKPIGSLSDSEARTLCIDQANYLAEPKVKADMCRFSAAVAASLEAAFSSGATDARVRQRCRDFYNECIAQPADVAACNDASAPPNCTATISELAACSEDTSALLHELAQLTPDCNSLTAAGLQAGNGGPVTTLNTSPASCLNFQTKCAGISDAAKSFSDQYCELISPCCGAKGLGSSCNLNVERAAREGSFDETAGATCLAALRARQTNGTFCEGLGHGSATWDVIPECASVFSTRLGPDPASERATTATPGVPCSGTIMHRYDGRPGNYAVVGNGGPEDGSLCDYDQGLYCDRETFSCAAGHAAGAYCESPEMCDPRSGYCDVVNHVCEPRIPAGGACTGSLLGECAEGSYCADTSLKCVAYGSTGAACSPKLGGPLPECASGICENGVCQDSLAPLCGK